MVAATVTLEAGFAEPVMFDQPHIDGFDLVAGAFPMGPSRRRARPGPEETLVSGFLSHFPFGGRHGERVTVFKEPRLESGFPDLVAVMWHPATTRAWSAQRRELRADDVRLLHLLGSTGPMREPDLAMLLGCRPRAILARLSALDLIRSTRAGWRAAPLHRAFAVKRIIAFEAKISAWSAALHQAALNRWFASESYLLVPRHPGADVATRARAAGVGVWVAGRSRPVVRAVRAPDRQPVSYASWLFNEWTWRHAAAVAGGAA